MTDKQSGFEAWENTPEYKIALESIPKAPESGCMLPWEVLQLVHNSVREHTLAEVREIVEAYIHEVGQPFFDKDKGPASLQPTVWQTEALEQLSKRIDTLSNDTQQTRTLSEGGEG